jgi:hypothetical protein
MDSESAVTGTVPRGSFDEAMFMEAHSRSGRGDLPPRWARAMVALALWAAIVALGSALTGTWLLSPTQLLPSHAAAPGYHKCMTRETGRWASCASKLAVPVKACVSAAHPHGRPTYDCGQPDALPAVVNPSAGTRYVPQRAGSG